MKEKNIKKENQQDKLFRLHPDPMFLYFKDTTRIVEVNDAAISTYGFSRAEFLAMKLEDFLVPEMLFCNGVFSRKVDLVYEATVTSYIQCKAGDIIEINARVLPFAIDDQEVNLLIATVVPYFLQYDVDLMKEAGLQEVSPWRLSSSGVLKIRSLSIGRLLGVDDSTQSISLKRYVDLLSKDHRTSNLRQLVKFLNSTDSQCVFEHSLLRPCGGEMVLRGIVKREEDSSRTGFYGVVQEVTDVVSLSEKVKELEEVLSATNLVARIGTWRVELEGETILWSQESEAMHELANLYSVPLSKAISHIVPVYREQFSSLLNECINSGRTIDTTIELLTTTGRQIWVRTVGEALRSDDGHIIAVQGSFKDITELKVAQTSAESNAYRLASTLESINDAFLVLDDQWRITYMNGRAETMLDQERGVVVGKVLWELFPGALGSSFERKIRDAKTTYSTLKSTEYVDSLGLWLEFNVYPSSDGLSMYVQDVTLEHQLSENLHLLEAAVSQQNDALIITKLNPIDAPDGPEIVYVNNAFERLTGYSFDESVGKTPRFLQGTNTQRTELDRLRQAFTEMKPVRVELTNYRKDGTEFEVEIEVVPLANSNGDHTHFVAVERDISERKKSERTMLANDERIRLYSSVTSDVIWDWNLESGSRWWSNAITNSFGYTLDELEEGVESWVNRIHPNERERVTNKIYLAIESDSELWSDEYSFLHANGKYKIVNDRACILRDDNGNAYRLVGSLVDVTERKDLDRRLLQSQKLEAIGLLTGGLAHDFNNLLTIILGNAEILAAQCAGDKELRIMAECISSAAETGAQLTNHLLAFARQQPLEPKFIALNKLIHELDGMMRRVLPEDIELEFVEAPGLWVVELDIAQFEAALLNLVINARDAMSSGGRLTIETANARLDDRYARANTDVKPGQYVRVSVTDQGCGMDAATIEKAFEPFFTTKSTGKGTGLGLSMVYGFAKQSSGHVKIYSEVGEGTSIHLYFPRVHREADIDQVVDKVSEVPGGDELILVVEDDDLVRQHLITQLKSLGYRVLSASSGPHAMKLIEEFANIDLLFTDIVMPGGMNGKELADAAQAIRPELNVLYTSGYSESAIVHQGRLDQGVELLHKPYRRSQMANKVRKVLNKRLA